MYFPKYWAKGTYKGPGKGGDIVETVSWGWSDMSKEHARSMAEKNALRAAQVDWSKDKEYIYSNRPLREDVLESISEFEIISRNSYGAEILNSSRVAFIDVDIQPAKETKGGFFTSLFGRKNAPGGSVPSLELLQPLKEWQRKNTNYGFRIYKTAAGFRYLLTSHPLSPEDSVVKELFSVCRSDKKYQQLCNIQKSFRARLTPKPWRCGLEKPTLRFPFESAKEIDTFKRWLEEYERTSSSFSTCQLVESWGPICDEILPIVKFHDLKTRAEAGAPLA